jgi:hypothetical protein
MLSYTHVSTTGVFDTCADNCVLYTVPSEQMPFCSHEWRIWQTSITGYILQCLPARIGYVYDSCIRPIDVSSDTSCPHTDHLNTFRVQTIHRNAMWTWKVNKTLEISLHLPAVGGNGQEVDIWKGVLLSQLIYLSSVPVVGTQFNTYTCFF